MTKNKTEKLAGYEEMRNLLNTMDMKNDFRFNHGHVSFDNPVSTFINEDINEGLIRTYPVDKTISYIKKYFNLDDQHISELSTENDSEPQIRVLIPDVGENKKLMDKAMALCGYYPGCSENSKNGILDIQYERKFNEDKTEEILDQTEYMYHISPSVYKAKIRKMGLIPYSRNKRFNYPERIHLLTDTLVELYTDDDTLMSIAEMLYTVDNTNKGKFDGGALYTVYKIDTERIPKTVHFFADPNMEGAVYTTDAIPSSSFVNIAHIDLDEETIVWER